MGILASLLALYAGVILINVLMSAMLWARQKHPLYRSLFYVWAAIFVSLLAQGIASRGAFVITLGFSSAFLVNVGLASLLGGIVSLPTRVRPFVMGLMLALPAAAVAGWAKAPFWMVALPVALAVVSPLLVTIFQTVRLRWKQLSTSGRALIYSCLLFCAHNIDFAFLRDKESLGPLGFAIAILVVFALSISANAVVMETEANSRSRVEEINRFQREFFANVTHELRTPLTMILAPIESLKQGEAGPLSVAQRGYVDTVWRNGVRLLKLINDLLDLAKADEGFLRMLPQKTELRGYVEDVVAFARPMAARKGLRLDVVVQSVPEDVYIDAERFERVLVNLIANGLKFTETGGVTVELSGDKSEARIAIADTGIGIAADQIGRIFERFTQADTSATRRYGGTGIGLAFAREIVKMHHGHITVTSAPGVGSRFVVHVPVGSGHFDSPGAGGRLAAHTLEPVGKGVEELAPTEWVRHIERHEAYRFGEIADVADRRRVPRCPDEEAGTRVLVVEDNLEVLELVHLTLHTEHVIMVAQDGKQGLELALRLRPDLVVTDFMMPEMDGLALVRALRANPETAETPIVMLTAKSTVEDRLSVRQAGADVYLSKPFSPRELAATVRALLEKRGRQVGRIMRAQVDSLESISAGLAHEIHNPLNFLKNSHYLIVENLNRILPFIELTEPLSEEQRMVLDKARGKIDLAVGVAGQGVRRIEHIVGIVRRYAREGYPSQLEGMDVDQAVADVISLVAPVGPGQCTVTAELRAAGVKVLCFPEELQQAFRCLIQNAVDAAGPGGQVWVRTRRQQPEVVMEVVDDGPGVAAGLRTRIFSPFFTTKPAGMGMGLAIVARVVSQVGGKVELTSSVDERTTFRIRVPEAEAYPSTDVSTA